MTFEVSVSRTQGEWTDYWSRIYSKHVFEGGGENRTEGLIGSLLVPRVSANGQGSESVTIVTMEDGSCAC